MYDLKPSQFIEWNRYWDLLTFIGFYIGIDQNQVMISNARVYFYVIDKRRFDVKK